MSVGRYGVGLFLGLALWSTSGFGQDLILKRSFQLKSENLQQALHIVSDDLRPLVEAFEVRLDSGSEIVKRKRIIGGAERPILKTSIKKCVLFACETVDLDAEFSLQPSKGRCDLNYKLKADLRKSSEFLTGTYSEILGHICMNRNSEGAKLQLTVELVRGEDYFSNPIQKVMYNFISLQADSMIASFLKVMKDAQVDVRP